jgi:hypothetical protein
VASPVIVLLGVSDGRRRRAERRTRHRERLVLQGVGQLSVQSMTSGDLPVSMDVVLLPALFVVLAGLVVDIA